MNQILQKRQQQSQCTIRPDEQTVKDIKKHNLRNGQPIYMHIDQMLNPFDKELNRQWGMSESHINPTRMRLQKNPKKVKSDGQRWALDARSELQNASTKLYKMDGMDKFGKYFSPEQQILHSVKQRRQDY